jgi:outer membrane immunogenic protein
MGVVMKKFVLAISMFSLVSGAASAADMPVKAFTAPAVPSWAGFYIGAHGGYGWKDDPFSQTFFVGPTTASITGFKAHGWVAGGQVGYNWQYASMVGGFELDVSATGIKGSNTATGTAPGLTTIETYGDSVKLLGSARGRLGFAPNSDWMLYGSGGLAWEQLDQTFATVQIAAPPGLSGSVLSSGPIDLFGWVLGAGVETRIAHSNWIARLEYLHYDFGHSRLTSSGTLGGGIPESNTAGNQTIDIVRAGLSFKFGS